MARRPSTVSNISFPLHTGNAEKSSFSPSINTPIMPPPRSDTLFANLGVNHGGNISEMDLDELFARYTVSEVKAIQRQLRADAEDKQEELRLMVGERYRDLLQASTSIISIAKSSERVIDTLQETKDAILAEEPPPLPRRKSVDGKDNTHLQMLQLLSAHMKLLLDAPEHLWRLIEGKKFFSAAWLFLLARVVHRALVRDDEQDEENWGSQGIDVLEQFPLVQRQWDAVSQFRPQIIHKATMSLREYTMSTEDTCAILLTLHLLDSRPLMETVSVLLDQRSKTLHTKLSRTPESLPAIISDLQSNGHPPETLTSNSTSRPTPRRGSVREVRQLSQTALDTISRTVTCVRAIFRQGSDTQLSLIGGVLKYIQSDILTNPTPLPSELQLTTQNLLMTMPSSTHFLLLPPNLRSYKPYVDLTSSSSSVSQPQIAQKLDDWFRKSTKGLQCSLERWLADLHSVKEVWSIRSSMRKWIHRASKLDEEEREDTDAIVDDVCRKQVTRIWNASLRKAEEAFRERLESTLADDTAIDTSPVKNLFKRPPPPTISQPGCGHIATDASFQKYKSSLRQQLIGRTTSLDTVLSVLEQCAMALQHDLSEMLTGKGDETRLVAQLVELYKPDAESLCSEVVNILNSAADNRLEHPENNMNSIVFIGRIADELSLSSLFVSDIGCEETVAENFREAMKVLCNRIVDCWRDHTVSSIVQHHWKSIRRPLRPVSIDPKLPSGPSSSLTQALLSLSTAIQQLGVSRTPSGEGVVARNALRHLIVVMLKNGDVWEHGSLHSLWDLAFLQMLVDIWGEWEDVSELLKKRVAQVRTTLNSEYLPTLEGLDIERDCRDALARTQLLFATLLPSLSPTHFHAEGSDKMAALLSFGTPSLDQQFQSALETAKPSSRFGLLLVVDSSVGGV